METFRMRKPQQSNSSRDHPSTLMHVDSTENGSDKKAETVVHSLLKVPEESLFVIDMWRIAIVCFISFLVRLLGSICITFISLSTTDHRGWSWLSTETALGLSTPTTSYLMLREASFLLDSQNASEAATTSSYRLPSPYVNDIVRIPPLYLYFVKFCGCLNSERSQFVLMLSVEVLTAICFGLTAALIRNDPLRADLAVRVQRSSETPKNDSLLSSTRRSSGTHTSSECANNKETEMVKGVRSTFIVSHLKRADFIEPWIICALLLLNPLTIIASFKLSLDPLRHLFLSCGLLMSFCTSLSLSIPLLSFSMAALVYLLPLPNAIGVVIALGHAVAVDKQSQVANQTVLDRFPVFKPPSFNEWKSYYMKTIVPLFLLTGTLVCLCHYISFHLIGNWDYWDSCVIALLTVRDVTPNLGIFWYLVQLIFLRARHLYIAAYQICVLVIVIPLQIKLFRQPLALQQVIIAAFLMFQPYPTMTDFPFIIALLLLDFQVVESMKEFTALVSTSIFSLILFPVMGHVWLRRNTGNPNFLYTAQLAFNVATWLLLSRYIQRSVEFHSGDRNLIESTSSKREDQSLKIEESKKDK